MKANIPKQTKRERELDYAKHEMVKRTLETCMLAFALVLGDEGNGTKRIDRHLNEFVAKLDEYVERYGEDCAVFALRKKAKELYDIEVMI